MNYFRGHEIEGWPPLLSDEEIAKLKEYIHKLHTTQPYPIYPIIEEINVFIFINFKKQLNHDIIRKMISIQLPDSCKTCIGVAMDSKRIEAFYNIHLSTFQSLQDTNEGNLNKQQQQFKKQVKKF